MFLGQSSSMQLVGGIGGRPEELVHCMVLCISLCAFSPSPCSRQEGSERAFKNKTECRLE